MLEYKAGVVSFERNTVRWPRPPTRHIRLRVGSSRSLKSDAAKSASTVSWGCRLTLRAAPAAWRFRRPRHFLRWTAQRLDALARLGRGVRGGTWKGFPG